MCPVGIGIIGLCTFICSPPPPDKIHVPTNVTPCPQAPLSLHRPCPSRSNNPELLIAPTRAAQSCIFTLPCLCPVAQPGRRLLLSSDASKALPLSQAPVGTGPLLWVLLDGHHHHAQPAQHLASGWTSLRPPPCACHCSRCTGLQSLQAGPSPSPAS